MKLQKDIDLKKYNTYGTSGSARYFILAKEKQDLIDGYNFANDRDIPFIVLGGGSNVLLSEKGFDGLVIVNRADKIEKDENKIKASSGATLAKMINYMKEEGLTGGEFLAGIPGTIGGAILGNAGAWGKGIGDIVDSVEFLSFSCHPERSIAKSRDLSRERKGLSRSLPGSCRIGLNDSNPCIKQINKDDIDFSYRESSFKEMDGIILGATLALKSDLNENVSKRVTEVLQKRKGKHPQGKTCGSFFKNIEVKNLKSETLEPSKNWAVNGKVAAGKLIEEAGCKGMSVGDARVSEVHANFLVNEGKATSDDIKKLAEQVQRQVYNKFGVKLEPEVRYL